METATITRVFPSSVTEDPASVAKPEIHQGYQIIKDIPAGDQTYVIGQRGRIASSVEDPVPFVVWRRDKVGKGFNAGSYCSTLEDAFEAVRERAANSIDSCLATVRKLPT